MAKKIKRRGTSRKPKTDKYYMRVEVLARNSIEDLSGHLLIFQRNLAECNAALERDDLPDEERVTLEYYKDRNQLMIDRLEKAIERKSK